MDIEALSRPSKCLAGSRLFRLVSVLMTCVMLVLAAGCLGDGTIEEPAVDLTGSWTVNLTGVGNERLILHQNGNNIRGNDGRGNPLAGSITGERFGLTIAQRGTTNFVELSGIASQTSMSGDYMRGINGARERGSFIGTRR